MFDEMFPILSTADLPRALGFYRDLLDATVTYQFPADGAPRYVGLALGASHLGTGQRTEPGDTANDQITLWVYATNCDAAVQRLREADVRDFDGSSVSTPASRRQRHVRPGWRL
jgi:lactoylglutathione lyase